MTEREIWRTVAGFDSYEVSDLGKVRRKTTRRGTYPGNILTARSKTTGGYQRVVLCQDGCRKTISIASLVAHAFIGDRPHAHTINHRDGDKKNNCLINLEYVTQSENVKHAYRTGLIKRRRGEDNPSAKLNEGQVKAIRELSRRGLNNIAIASRYGVDSSMISMIINYKRWSHVE